jgi:hypothetical protein
MEAEDPLSQLADIHLPDAVSMWPPAPGWWLLAALFLGALVLLCMVQFRRWQQRQRLVVVLTELAQARAAWNQADAANHNTAGLALLYAINSLLKRVALLHFPEAQVAPLVGSAWLRFLDTHGATADFSNGVGRVLADGEYRPVFDADADALCQLARRWIEQQYQRPRQTGKAAARAAGVAA